MAFFKWRRVFKDWNITAYERSKFLLERYDIECRIKVTNYGYRPGAPDTYRMRRRWERAKYCERNDCYHIYVRKKDAQIARQALEKYIQNG